MKLLKPLNILMSFCLFFFSCEEPDAPDSIWDENDQGGTTPILNSVEPSQGAFAGIDTIMISGQHFSTNGSETEFVNKAFFLLMTSCTFFKNELEK